MAGGGVILSREDGEGSAAQGRRGSLASLGMTWVSLAFALWGLAIGISLLPLWQRAAPADQLPGYATQQGFDAHTSFRFFAALTLITLLLPLALRPITRRLADGQAWARNATIAAALVAMWFVVLERNPFWVIVPFALAIAAFTLLRHVPLYFTRRDWILLPTFGTTLLSLLDVVRDIQVQRAAIVAAAIVLIVRIAVARIPSPLPPAYAFLLAPLGLVLQTGFFARDQRYFGWHALLLVIVTPFVMRAVLRNERRAAKALLFVIYPLVAFAYTNAMSIPTAEGKERLDFFEDSHSFPIASEYLRGELPYRDALPVHGLGKDGLLEYLAFNTGGVSAGSAMRARGLVSSLNTVAIYALGTAMTGSPEAGIASYFFANLTGLTRSTRATPALFTLVLIVLAIRKRDTRYLIAAGIGAVLCGVNSLDYAFYTFIALVVAVLRWSGGRFGRRHVSAPEAGAAPHAILGLAIGAVPLFLAFLTLGILDDFLRSTFSEVLSMGPAYVLNLFGAPPPIAEAPTFPELLPAVFRGSALPYIAWCGIVIATAVLLARPRRRSTEAFVIVGVWVAVAAVSYAERHHLYFIDAIAPMLIGGTFLAIRKRAALAPVLVAALIIASMPTTHIGVLGWVRRQRGPVEEGWTEVRDVPRARGALIRTGEAAEIASARKYVDLTLQRDETFFDFTNRAIFYYLLNRDMPIRHVEVAYYESEAEQRAVIAAIERNPKIRAALVPLPGGVAVDGVVNQARAPLVWQYLQEHFYPDFEEGSVVFWRRR